MAQKSFKHGMSFDGAQRATKQALVFYAQKYPQYAPTAKWTDSTSAEIGCTIYGQRVTGTVRVDPTSIVLNIDVPRALKLFEGVAVGAIATEVETYIASARQTAPA